MTDTLATRKGTTHAVASYALSLRPEAISAEAMDRTKQLFLDFLGVALGGRALAMTSPALLEGVRALAGGTQGPCSVAGDASGHAPQHAALANAALAHAMDFDDTHRDAIMHLGAPVLAALLALGEQRGSSGRDFLTAAVAGYEVGAKLGRAHGDRVHLRGFHPTATTGIFSTTAAAACLMVLDEATVEHALGLALSLSSGSQQFAEGGGGNKPLQVGMAAHNALYALTLAQAGFPGTSQPLEGRFGYYATYAEPGSDLDAIAFDADAASEVLNVGIKPYPCCRYSHGTIDGVAAIARREQLAPDEIESIEVTIPAAGFGLVGADPDQKRRPAGVVDAQFSAYFAAAATAADGAYSWDSYARLRDPRVERLMDRTTVHGDAALYGMQTHLRVSAKRGSWELDVPFPKGEPEEPLSWDEVERKFLGLAGLVLEPKRAVELASLVRRLDASDDLSELTSLLRPSK